MKALFAICVLVYAASVQARDWITVPLASYHFERGRDYCEINPGLGYETDISKSWRFHAGGYHNSNCRPSTYLCASSALWEPGYWRLGGAICGFTGYHEERRVNGKTERENKVLIVPLPAVSYERRTWGVDILIVPPEKLFKLFGREVDEKDQFKGSIGLVWKKPF